MPILNSIFTRGFDWTTDRDNSVRIRADRHDEHDDDVATAFNAILDGTAGFIGATLHFYGTVSLPGISFNGDEDTGLYRVSANTLGFAANGTKAAELTADGIKAALIGAPDCAGDGDTVTLSTGIGPAALTDGAIVFGKANAANTGAATLDVNTIGAKAIRRQGDAALSSGDQVANGTYMWRYDADYNSSAGAWVLLNPSADGKLTGIEKIKTADYTVLVGDDGDSMVANKATAIAFTMSAAATLGGTFMIPVKNIGAGALTITPDGSETIDGEASLALAQGDSRLITSNGTALRSFFAGGTGSGSGGGGVNIARNGSFAVNQRVTMPTTDNAYCVDGWRLLLEAASAATVAQDTADVPVGAGYALKLTVGSGNNNKFGVFSVMENKNILKLRGTVCSIRVPLKATAGLTDGAGKIRIGIVEFTGTANATTGDPISSWGAEGTNPTLAANWAFANTPAALSVTTSWADYLVENVSIASGATNIAILVWSDDKTNTTTTDILRIGGYVTLDAGATAPAVVVLDYTDELRRCRRHMFKTFKDGDAPADAIGYRTSGLGMRQTGTNLVFTYIWADEMMAAPTVTLYNPEVSDANKGYDYNTSAAIGASINSTNTRGAEIVISGTDQNLVNTHITAIADL